MIAQTAHIIGIGLCDINNKEKNTTKPTIDVKILTNIVTHLQNVCFCAENLI